MCYMAIPSKQLCTHHKHALVLLKNARGEKKPKYYQFYFVVKKVKVCDVAMPHEHGKFEAARIQVPLADLSV